MSDRLTDAELGRLEELHLHVGDGRVVPPRVYDFDPYSSSEIQRAFDLSAHACIPALLAEVRERRARESTSVIDHEQLAIEDGFLVWMHGNHNCGGSSGEWPYAHESHCGMEPLERLDDLPGWPGGEA